MEVAEQHSYTAVTIGPDGTVIGRRVTAGGKQPFVSSLAMLWIDMAWEVERHEYPDLVKELALTQDGLGKPGGVPPGLDYLPVIHASTFEATIRMLAIARKYLPDERVAALLEVSEQDLQEVLASAYGL